VRTVGYGQLFDELRTIIFTRRSSKFHTQQITPNVTVYPTSSVSRLTYIRDAVRVARQLAADHPFGPKTVVSGQDPFECGLAAYRIARHLGAKLHLQLHTDLASPLFRASALNRLRFQLAKHLLPRASAVRVVSEHIRRSLVSGFNVKPERITVLPIFVDPSSFNPDEPVDSSLNLRLIFPEFSFIVLAVCRLTPEKQLDVAIEAAAEAARHWPGLGLAIVGEGPLRARLGQLVHRLGAEACVKFIPWQQRLADLYRSADIFIQTSAFEGYGMSVVEAALSGVPIVSTRVGVAAELAEANVAIGCSVGDAAAIAQALVRLANDEQERRQLAAGARSWALSHLPDRSTYLQRYCHSLEAALT
jgi:glycosyltransferase involved in cell wall biosynthesis